VGGRRVWTDNWRFGLTFFPPSLVRTPDPIAIPVSKPSGTIRVFVLGSSAAKGDPAPAYGFSRILDVMLGERYPGRRFEVVNTAMTAINSNVVLPIARNCARLQPDIFVVYTGNNEVIGPFGAGTILTPHIRSLWAIRASVAVRGTRIGQLLDSGLQRVTGGRAVPKGWGGMAMFLNSQVRQDDPRMQAVYAHYRGNLEDICKAGLRAGAGVVLCTLPVNLRECAPFASAHRPGLGAQQLAAWNALCDQGAKAEAAHAYADALHSYQRAEAIDGTYAELQYRIARCLFALGDYPHARERYARALDLDTLRFRADTRINATVRQVASLMAAQGVRLADGQKAVEAASLHGIPGHDLLYEHVHLNFHGNYVFARAVLSQVDQLLASKGLHPRRPAPTETECAQQLAFTAWDQYGVAKAVLDRLGLAPFTNQLDHEQDVRWARGEVERLRAATQPSAVEAAKAQYEHALARRPNDWVLHARFGDLLVQGLRDAAGAVRQYRTVLASTPQDWTTLNSLGSALAATGDLDGGIAVLQEALRIKPAYPEALNNMGMILAQQGKANEALARYQEAIALDPGSAMAHGNLGDLLREQGKIPEAISQYEQALRIDPELSGVRNNLAVTLAKQGKKDEALAQLRIAARLDPQSAETHCNLGQALLSRRDIRGAEAEFRKAVRLRPDLAPAQYGLARLLGAQGRYDEAIPHFQAAVQADPGHAMAHFLLAQTLLLRGRGEEAIEQYREAVRCQPDNPAFQRGLQQAISVVGGPMAGRRGR